MTHWPWEPLANDVTSCASNRALISHGWGALCEVTKPATCKEWAGAGWGNNDDAHDVIGGTGGSHCLKWLRSGWGGCGKAIQRCITEDKRGLTFYDGTWKTEVLEIAWRQIGQLGRGRRETHSLQ